MTRMVRLLIAAITLGTLIFAAPAHAEDHRNHRLASRDVCLERPASVRGWHLREAAAAWNATGLVAITLRRSCAGAPARIVVSEFWEPGGPLNGETDWPGYLDGRWSEADLTQWLYPVATIRLNAANLRGASGDRHCWGWYLAAHELGHALGLWHEGGRSRVMGSNGFAFRKRCWRLGPADVADLATLGYGA